MGPYGNLPVTGTAAVMLGSVAVARPIAAVALAAAVIAVGLALRFSNRRPAGTR